MPPTDLAQPSGQPLRGQGEIYFIFQPNRQLGPATTHCTPSTARCQP